MRLLSLLLCLFFNPCLAQEPAAPDSAVTQQNADAEADVAAVDGGMDLTGAVPVDGEITEDSLAPVESKIDELVAAGAKTLTFRINSRGGDVDAGEKFIEKLESLNRQGIATICIADNNDMSMGLYLLQGCQERWATKRTTFLGHNASMGAQGNADDLDAAAHMLRVSSDAIAEFVGARFNMGVEKYKAKIAHGNWVFGWKEALHEGVIDKTVDPWDVPFIYTLDKPENPLMKLLLGGQVTVISKPRL